MPNTNPIPDFELQQISTRSVIQNPHIGAHSGTAGHLNKFRDTPQEVI